MRTLGVSQSSTGVVLAVVVTFGAAVAFLPLSSAHADCTQWAVSGKWRLDQNNRYWVDLDIQQKGNVLTGHGRFTSKQSTGGASSVVGTVEPVFHAGEGKLEGTVDGNAISIIAHWKGEGSLGEYTGTVSPQGWLEGYKGTIRDDGSMHGTASGVDWSSVVGKADCVEKQIEDKPQVPIGDVTKPVTPPPYEPLPRAGTGIFKQMKP